MDGRVRILQSRDGVKWSSVAHFEREGIDLRDPKLSVRGCIESLAKASTGEGMREALWSALA